MPCFRRMIVCAIMALDLSASAQTKDWIQPTPEELAMTSEPKAPGEPAIVLSYEEYADVNKGEGWIHLRIKILTDAGRSEGTVALPERVIFDNDLSKAIMARTIHRNGSVVDFRGTPQNSLATDGTGSNERVISLPDVEVGSIVEVIYHFYTPGTRLSPNYAPVWRVQGRLFRQVEQFTLVAPAALDKDTVRWVATLPVGAEMRRTKNTVSLTLHDVPASPLEELMPPSGSILYKVRFFYYNGTRDEFWGKAGEYADRVWENYDTPNKALTVAVAEIVAPTDTDEQKLHKIYSAVSALENTDLTRQRFAKEDRKEGFRVPENSDDIWQQKRGTSTELTLLFVAMARAAGYHAYPMAVTSRGRTPFDQDVLSWSQLDDMVAIVLVKGQDIFFDPGTRTCAFAHMAPWHANVIGVSSEGKLIKFRYTPEDRFGVSLQQQVAELKLDADGNITGQMQLGWSGNAGLLLRLLGFISDQATVEQGMKGALLASLPEGVEVKLESLKGLETEGVPLLATFSVSGKLGLMTAKRMVLPADFFESRSSRILVLEKRTLPIEFPEMIQLADVVVLHLPAGMSVESLPAGQLFHIGGDTLYKSTAITTGSEAEGFTVRLERTFALKRLDYKVADYPTLHEYFGQVATADHQQVVLLRNPGAASGTGQ